MSFRKSNLENAQPVSIPSGNVLLEGLLTTPSNARGLVLFVHGSGSSRHSTRNQYVAAILNQANLATLLFDLLTPKEDAIDEITSEFRFDINLLAERLVEVTKWCLNQSNTQSLTIGYFGASTGGGAALVAGANLPENVKAIVSRGGRPDLAGNLLSKVKAPTLLIVGGNDEPVIEMNQTAMAQMSCETKLEIIPKATHLFEEPGALDRVADLAKEWFLKYLV